MGAAARLAASAASEARAVAVRLWGNQRDCQAGEAPSVNARGRERTAVRAPRRRAGLDFLTRLVLVSDQLFHHLVNDNLEVRTSVQIDDETGAAKSRALFTYEAIPRGTVLGFEVVINDRRANGIQTDAVTGLLRKAFHGLKLLGIGGMGTRGFGRIEVLGQNGSADGQ
jgi:CRISPR/Cas system CMR subunit Cmr4 (Cas7 group RAMP superfamily)